MKRHLLSLPFIVLAIAGCDPVSERDCGVFDHPDLAQWQADTSEATVRYMSSDGTTMDFVRQIPVLNEPFTGSDGSSNDEDVTCELTASFRMQATDDSLVITSLYLQQEQLLLRSENESLLIDFVIEAPAGMELTSNYIADITIGTTRATVDATRVIYLEDDQETEEIGGQSYEDVIRINAVDTSPEIDAENGESIDQITQIVLAREFGVVAFTDANDMEFVRVPSE